MKLIESIKNDWVKNTKKLEKKKYRDKAGVYLIEGEHLVEEAINNHAEIKQMILTEKAKQDYAKILRKVDEEKCVQVTDNVIRYLSDLPSPQPIMAIVKKNVIKHPTKKKHLLILDNVQDPGNVGTMIRTADAAGFSGVILGHGCCDVYNSKVVRSMQGSQFHLSIEEADLSTKLNQLKKDGYQLCATELNAHAVPLDKIYQTEEMAIIMGNEGQGVNPSILAISDQTIYIPMSGKAESLNVSVAAGIVMFSL